MRLQYQPMQNRNFSCLSNCQKIMMSASSWTIFLKKKKFQKNFSRQISGKISDFQGNSIQSG